MMNAAQESTITAFCLLSALTALVCTNAVAQNYPVKPVRLVVGQAPGGATDVVARLVAPRLGVMAQ